MNPFHKFAAISLAALSFASFDATASIDVDASIILLRTSCEEVPGITLNNCFTNTDSLVNWIANTRNPKPSASAPLTVQIGPGTFGALSLTCTASEGFTGHIKFAGADRQLSRFKGTTFLVSHPAIIKNCTKLHFSDLSFESQFYGYIDWRGGGTSVWENVDVAGQSRAWVETSCGSAPGNHYWFGSRLASSGFGTNQVYQAGCDKSWFYGSELSTDAMGPVIVSGQTAEVHVYGSNLRVDDSSGCCTGDVRVIEAGNGSSIHIHGTGIDAAGGSGRTVRVFSASNGGSIHASISAYNLQTGSGGSIVRIDNGGGTGHVHAPYLWEHIPDPATAPNFTSANGADQTTVTVGTSDGHPHTAVYSSTCPANARWYDQVDKVCRSQ